MNPAAVMGLLVMVVSQSATFAKIEPFYSWNTPIAWTGFILFADSIVWRARGRSWMRSNPREFMFLALASIPLWIVFEFYNLYLENWYYTGLPENFWLRQFGYAWSFATIWPAIFEAADLIDVWRGSSQGIRLGERHTYLTLRNPSAAGWISAIAGVAMLLWPLVWPSPYLAAPVWLGFIFLLEPLNIRLGADSLLKESGRYGNSRLNNLVLSGFLCGVLWEFWNYWAGAKWHYTVPIMENLKIFEMPLPGYLGFPAFALECFTMYVFVRAIAIRIVPSLKHQLNYPIGSGSGLPWSAVAPAKMEAGHHD
jgi:hypothetical protein